MKRKKLILGLLLAIFFVCLFAAFHPANFILHHTIHLAVAPPPISPAEWQAKNPGKKFEPRLDWNSQSNIEVFVADAGDALPCPPEYTNLISNTNLFTLEEQQLIKSIPLLYGSVTSTSGPPGTVVVHLNWYHKWLNQWHNLGTMRFQFTNSDVCDNVSANIHHVRNKSGDGYDVHYRVEEEHGVTVPDFRLIQYKRGVLDGLRVDIHGDHCIQWLRFVNGLAVDRWLWWNPNGEKVVIWVKFNEPYDFMAHYTVGKIP